MSDKIYQNMAFERNKTCVTLTSLKNTTDWAINSTTEAMDVLALFYPPYLSYNDWEMTVDNTSILYYQFCGPLILLLRRFSERINTK